MGPGHESDALHTLVPSPYRRHCRKARRFHRARRPRRRYRGVFGQDAHTTGDRRVELSQRRHTQHVRGSRLLRMGHIVAGIRGRRHALHTHHLHIVHRRRARLQDTSAQIEPCGGKGRARCMPVLLRRRKQGDIVSGLGTGIFPRRRIAMGSTSRPDAHRPHPHGPRQRKEPTARRPLFRGHTLTRAGIHDRARDRGAQIGYTCQNTT